MNGANDNKGMNGVKGNRTISWNKDVPVEKMSFTMRREIDKAREETDLINQLRNVRGIRFEWGGFNGFVVCCRLLRAG